jgi:hypothetical protein
MGHNITFSTYVTIKLHICITIHLILSNPRFAPLLIVIVVGILSPPRFCHHRLVPPHPDPKHCLPSGLNHYSPILSVCTTSDCYCCWDFVAAPILPPSSRTTAPRPQTLPTFRFASLFTYTLQR